MSLRQAGSDSRKAAHSLEKHPHAKTGCPEPYTRTKRPNLPEEHPSVHHIERIKFGITPISGAVLPRYSPKLLLNLGSSTAPSVLKSILAPKLFFLRVSRTQAYKVEHDSVVFELHFRLGRVNIDVYRMRVRLKKYKISRVTPSGINPS